MGLGGMGVGNHAVLQYLQCFYLQPKGVDIFFLLFHKKHIVDTHLKHFTGALLMSTHNKYFLGEITRLFIWLLLILMFTNFCHEFQRINIRKCLKFHTPKFLRKCPMQIVQTQIRLLLKEQSDQGLHCLPFH